MARKQRSKKKIDTKKDTKPKKRASPREVHILIRIVIAVILFIIGIIVSNIGFFKRNPLFGINFLAEASISLVAALLGFFTLPRLFVQLKRWFETLVIKTVSDIVSNFWEQQAKRMQDSKRQKQKKQKIQKEKQLKDSLSNGILLDTSVLVDGRILDIVKTGFLSSCFVVPSFVLDELHLISDNEDAIKRRRGRRGLDILNELKKHAKVFLPENLNKTKVRDVDKALVAFAKKYKVKLMTLDFNLNKVAKASNISVLNINELADAIKPELLPGETLKIKIVQEGKEKKQGVGYLPNGTMVVVEDAKELVGKTLHVQVTKSIQSAAGRMIFAKIH